MDRTGNVGDDQIIPPTREYMAGVPVIIGNMVGSSHSGKMKNPACRAPGYSGVFREHRPRHWDNLQRGIFWNQIFIPDSGKSKNRAGMKKTDLMVVDASFHAYL